MALSCVRDTRKLVSRKDYALNCVVLSFFSMYVYVYVYCQQGEFGKCILFVYRIFTVVLYISIHFNQASWSW